MGLTASSFRTSPWRRSALVPASCVSGREEEGNGREKSGAEVSSMPQVVRATAPADALPPLAGAGMDGGVQR